MTGISAPKLDERAPKTTYELLRSYLKAILVGQHLVVAPCSQWTCRHSLKENTEASMFWCILLQKTSGKRKISSKHPTTLIHQSMYFFFLSIETQTPDIAAALRTFSSFWYEQWKNTSTESDIFSDATHKNGTSQKVNSSVLFFYLFLFPFKFYNICLKCILNF